MKRHLRHLWLVPLLTVLAATSAAAQDVGAFSYSLRTPLDTQASISYATVIEPGEGQNVVSVVSQPQHGSVQFPSVIDGSGTQAFVYTPVSGFAGFDQFIYRVQDGSGDVSFAVISFNVGNVEATAEDDDLLVSTEPDTFLDVLFNDLGFADPVTFEILQLPAHGTLDVTVPDPAWQGQIGVFYSAAPGYTGPDSFTYRLGDGIDLDTATVSLTVSADGDGDGEIDALDNCPLVANPGQEDGDSDGVGNVCDNCLARANPSQQDSDDDGRGDTCDNCTLRANANQRDSDGDLYGNVCDADLNNSGGTVNFGDLALFRTAFGNVNANADLNDSGGVINFADLAVFRTLFGHPRGPSGVAPP